MIRPTNDQRRLLGRFERLAFDVSHTFNRNPRLKSLSHGFLRHVGARWIDLFTHKLVVCDGLEHIRDLRPPAGTLVVANHRTLFDQYLISMLLFQHSQLPGRIYFPVRSEFFYDNPLGFVLNGVMSGWSMYPPVLRQPERSAFNRFTVDKVVELLGQPGTVVGFHPEGTRNKTNDPYTLLPAQPGVGQLIMAARPTVLPVFIHGMSNHVGQQIWSNFSGKGRKIIVVFGKPLDLERFYAFRPRLKIYVDIAKYVREEIMRLGARERQLRAGIEG